MAIAPPVSAPSAIQSVNRHSEHAAAADTLGVQQQPMEKQWGTINPNDILAEAMHLTFA